jgi:hypothetical protein
VIGICLLLHSGPITGLVRGLGDRTLYPVLGGLGVLLLGILVVGGLRRVRRPAMADLRGLLHPTSLAPIVSLSTLVIAGHVLVLLIAARAVGVGAPVRQLVPLALLILVASALPTNIGGWGPREGAASWLFALAGIGAGPGLAASTAYGVLTLVAVSPGVVVLLAGRRRTAARRGRPITGPVAREITVDD